jgi:hypothetical protein
MNPDLKGRIVSKQEPVGQATESKPYGIFLLWPPPLFTAQTFTMRHSSLALMVLRMLWTM